MSDKGEPSNRLRRLREAAGLSREELAGEMESPFRSRRGQPISKRTIERWEAAGRHGIPMQRALWLAERFGCSVDHLLGLDSQPNGNGWTGPERRRSAA